jgi:hypothetical protein
MGLLAGQSAGTTAILDAPARELDTLRHGGCRNLGNCENQARGQQQVLTEMTPGQHDGPS